MSNTNPMPTFRTMTGDRAQNLTSLMNVLRNERKMSAVAGRRWRLACFVLGRPSYMVKP